MRIVGVNEATYYYHKKKSQEPFREDLRKYNSGRPTPGYSLNNYQYPVSDEQIKEWLLELVSGEESAYGYRKLTVCLRRQYNLIINKKKVYRLCKELNILAHQHRRALKYQRKLAVNHEITCSNQLWQMDIKYAYITGENRFLYLLSIIDVFDRAIVDYYIGLSCNSKDAVQTLQRALMKRRCFAVEKHPILRTDNGPQFVSNLFEESCKNFQVEHERIPPKTPNMNAYIESFHASLERECMAKQEFENYQHAYKVITDYIYFYNYRRIHGSLQDMPPVEFQKKMINQLVSKFTVKV